MEKWEILYTVDENVNGMAAMENSMAVPQKIKYSITIRYCNFTSGYISKRTWNILKRYLVLPYYCCIICISQKVEVTQASIDGWMEKQNVHYAYNWILLNLTKRVNSDMCYSMINPKDIMLSEICQSQKNEYCRIPFTQGAYSNQIYRDGK